MCVCAGAGGVGKTTTSAAIALGMAARGAKVAVVTIDPAKRLANALGLEELQNEPRRVEPERLATSGLEISRRAVGDDARPQAHVRRADRADRAGPGKRPGDQGQPRLPRAVHRGLGLAGVHRRGQAVRPRPGGRFRPAGARHAAVAQRARLPRRPGPADLVPRGTRRQGVRAADRAGDARARPRRLAAAVGAAPGDRRRPAQRPDHVLRAAGRHDRRLQRAGRPGPEAAAGEHHRVPARDLGPARADRRGDLVPPHARAEPAPVRRRDRQSRPPRPDRRHRAQATLAPRSPGA